VSVSAVIAADETGLLRIFVDALFASPSDEARSKVKNR